MANFHANDLRKLSDFGGNMGEVGAFEGVVGVDTICRLKCGVIHALQRMHIDSARGLIILKNAKGKKIV